MPCYLLVQPCTVGAVYDHVVAVFDRVGAMSCVAPSYNGYNRKYTVFDRVQPDLKGLICCWFKVLQTFKVCIIHMYVLYIVIIYNDCISSVT